jgi:uncharacterized repeat protein (TIGR03843 family)
MPNSSNATFLARVSLEGRVTLAIYKPLRGERPLWDFEPGLHRREVAAWRLSEALGLGIVPPTVLRDGPLGEGSVQLFVDADEATHYFDIYERRTDLHDALRVFAFFDIVANNTDRKAGHVLLDHEDRLWGIDHGVCFAADFKLRTVIWEFGGEPLPSHLVDAAVGLAASVPLDVAVLLADDEVAALAERAAWLAEHRVFPVDRSGRAYPWPLL